MLYHAHNAFNHHINWLRMSLSSWRNISARTRKLPTGRSIELFHQDLSISMALRCAVGVPLMLMTCCRARVDTRLDKTPDPLSRGGRSNDRSREGWSMDGRRPIFLRWCAPPETATSKCLDRCYKVGLGFILLQAAACVTELGWHAISKVQDDLQDSLSYREKEGFQFETVAKQTKQTV